MKGGRRIAVISQVWRVPTRKPARRLAAIATATTAGPSTLAAVLDPNGTTGKLVGYLDGVKAGFSVDLAINDDDTFTGQTQALSSSTGTGRTPTYPATTTSQLLHNGDFNISTNTNYFVFGAALPDDYFWQPFEGAYIGDPANVSTVASPTGGKVLIVDGQPYSGTWYNGNAGTEVKADGGKVFTLSFDAFFPADYSSTTTSISFWNDASAALLLDATPELVHTDRYTVNYIRKVGDPGTLLPEFAYATYAWLTRDIAPSGVMGDPNPATAENGRRWCSEMSSRIAAALVEMYAFEHKSRP
jgi:hypothetical protein